MHAGSRSNRTGWCSIYLKQHDYIVKHKIQVSQLFVDIDADGNGELDVVEFGEAIIAMGFKMEGVAPNSEQIQAAFDVLDYDQGGCVDATEFLVAVKGQKRLFVSRAKAALASAVANSAPAQELYDLIAEAEAIGIAVGVRPPKSTQIHQSYTRSLNHSNGCHVALVLLTA